MLYYQVVTKFYDNGAIDVSHIKVFEGDKMPENSKAECAVCDVYYDYFNRFWQAETFRNEALREAGR